MAHIKKEVNTLSVKQIEEEITTLFKLNDKEWAECLDYTQALTNRRLELNNININRIGA